MMTIASETFPRGFNPQRILGYEALNVPASTWMARWQSGDAEDCKSLYAGSIPARASNAVELRRSARNAKRLFARGLEVQTRTPDWAHSAYPRPPLPSSPPAGDRMGCLATRGARRDSQTHRRRAGTA